MFTFILLIFLDILIRYEKDNKLLVEELNEFLQNIDGQVSNYKLKNLLYLVI